jgi:autotransporter translocation and assembly factor TamB
MPRRWLVRVLRWSGYAIGVLLVAALAAFGLLQTSPGLALAARLASGFFSAPGFLVEIKGLGGTLPFDMRAERIEVADAKGVWLALDDARIDLSRTALIGRQDRSRPAAGTGRPAPIADAACGYSAGAAPADVADHRSPFGWSLGH